MATTVQHPLLDFLDGTFACVETKAKVVFFSEGIADFLKYVRGIDLTPVIITSPAATMTFAARYMLEVTGAMWIHRVDDGFLDTRTGHVVRRISALVDSATLGRAVEASAPEAPAYLQAVFGVTVQHPAAGETQLGGTVGSLATSLTGWGPSGWGLHEPAGLTWSPDDYTSAARRHMPESRFVFSGGGSTSFQAVSLVRRTPKGVEETVAGGAIVATAGADNSDIIGRLPQILVDLANNATMPVIGTVSVKAGGRVLGGTANAPGASLPVAGLIGPRAVRDLGIDIDDFSRRFPVIVAGRKRLPSVVVPYTELEQGSWEHMYAALEALGDKNIRRAMGFPQMPTAGNVR